MKNTLLKITTISTIALMASAMSSAEGLYSSINIGQSDLGNDYDKSTSWSIATGYEITPNFAAEIAYQSLGSADASRNLMEDGELEMEGFGFSLVGAFPVADQVDIFGKVGVLAWDAEFTGTTEDGNRFKEEEDDSDLTLGFGAKYKIDETFAVKAEYQRIDGDEAIHTYSVGASIHF